MKRHAGGQASETRQERRKRARRKERERKIKRAANILRCNTSLAERARLRGESTARESSRGGIFGGWSGLGGTPWRLADTLATDKNRRRHD